MPRKIEIPIFPVHPFFHQLPRCFVMVRYTTWLKIAVPLFREFDRSVQNTHLVEHEVQQRNREKRLQSVMHHKDYFSLSREWLNK